MCTYALGIDVGTTSVKTILLSSEGKIAAEVSCPHDLLSPHPGWAEEDAEVWWSNVVRTLVMLNEAHHEKMRRIAAIACSGMVPAIVLLDEAGRPLRRTIQQNDMRAALEIEELTDALDQELLLKTTGSRTNSQHVLPRLLWVKRHEPEVFAKVHTVMGSYDYIAYRLTGARSLESNFAAESGLYDIRTRRLLEDQLLRYGISPALFPPMHASNCVIGRTKGVPGCLPAGIPVLAGTADHVASTLSAGILEEGDLLIKFGGAGDILYCTDDIRTDRRLFFDYHIVPGKNLINGCMAASGSLVKWFTKDILRSEDPDVLKEMDDRAAQLPPGSEGLIILPYFLGEKTPIFDPGARGVFYGLTLSHQPHHIFRGILEAVIYGFRHHVEVLHEIGCVPKHIIATNGGAKSRIWCQIAADVLNRPIRAYATHPGSALGAAFLAGMEGGVFQSWEEIRLFLSSPRVFEPDAGAAAVYDGAYRMYRTLYEQLIPLNRMGQRLYEGSRWAQ